MAIGPGEGPRERLLEAGIRLLEQDGPEALNARKLASEIGASTQVVYTHFGGMAGFYQALIRESFVLFGERLRAVPLTDDPVADLLALGLTYRENALTNPQRYRFMSGVTAPGTGVVISHDIIAEGTPSVLDDVNATFLPLVEAVRRAMAVGRMRDDDVIGVAGQFWSMIHGFVFLELAGVFGHEGHGVVHVLAPHAVNLLVGLGDEREAAEASALAVAPDPLVPEGVTIPAAGSQQPRRGRRPGR
ncbi:TetR/AcrR family transcriptional regulator [Thermomonospora umbrina]|uniref:TetR family transcriptional regulator n=1 Tax=Thermomonospora umbrina TaxID=111806 RepID=A0A3D9SIZ6_9ACTN|nr:TetR/AcrR family transcriptional regulator [Thermomonospora umbrina]REE95918.1 TetR family transcriptional regulator [Thermomonospora umbrina]